MTKEQQLIIDLTNALQWAMPYALKGHEASYPGETYPKDGYVADSVTNAQKTLEAGKQYRSALL